MENNIPKKTTKKTSAAKPKQEKPKSVAVYSSGNLYYQPLGRLEKGYTILSPEVAQQWMTISNKVREATPEEVAIAYGV